MNSNQQLTVSDELQASTTQAQAQAEALTVTDKPTYDTAMAFLSANAGLKKKIKAFFKDIKDPLNAALKDIRGKEKAALEPVEGTEGVLKAKMSSWVRAENAKAQAEAVKQREAAKEAGLPEDLVTVAKPDVAGQRKILKWRVTDESKVPDTYKMLDGAKITAQVKATKLETDIPGIEAYEDSITVAT